MKNLSQKNLSGVAAVALAALCASPLAFGKIVIDRIAASRPVELYLPATPDSIVAVENPFSMADLLKSAAAPSRNSANADMFSPLEADTSGIFRLILPQTGSDDIPADRKASLTRFFTSIRPDAFFTGKLKISTPGGAKVYLDGREIISKASFDSVPEDASGAITMTPFRNAKIGINLLTSGSPGDITLNIELQPDSNSSATGITQGPELKSRFNLNCLGGGKRVASASISPDGKYVIMNYSLSTDGKEITNYADVLTSDKGDIVFSDMNQSLDWLPNAKSTLYFSKTAPDGTFSILTLDPATSKRGVLAANLPSDAKNYHLAPDASYAVFYNRVNGEKENGIMRRVTAPDDRIPGNRDRHYLSMLNLQSGLCVPLTYGGSSTTLLDISPDSKKILYFSSRQTPEEFPFYDGKVIEMDPFTLRTDTLPGFDSSLVSACYSPDGKEILALAGPNAFEGIGLNAGAHEYGNDFDIQAYIYNPATGKARAMTRDFNPSLDSDAVWDKADGNIYFRAASGFDKFVYRLIPSSGKIDRLTSDIDYVRNFSVSSIGVPKLAYTGLGYDYAGRAFLLNTKTGASRLLDDPLEEYMKGIDLGRSEDFKFVSSDGTTIDGTLTFPPDFDPAKKYPMITYYYGGTTPSTRTNTSPYTPNLFASFGYIVYTINPSGTIGYGQEFSARHVNAWGAKTADEIIEGVKKVCEANDFILKDKIGCIGASYGGFMTQLLQTKTDIFAAAVSHAGISNIASYWGEGFWGYSYNAVAAARSYPWTNRTLFTENSPLFHADKIHTPLLLLHGTEDTNVPPGESIQLFNALKILGRDVEFITVENANHIILDFEKRKEWHATIMAWFEKWLKNDPRWWNSIYKNN